MMLGSERGSEAFRDLDRALRDFIASKKGQRKGRRLGFPRFKKRGMYRDSFRFSTGAIGCAGATVTLPRLALSGRMSPLVSSRAGSGRGRRSPLRRRGTSMSRATICRKIHEYGIVALAGV